MPNDAFLREPTGWGGLYNIYGWREVTRTLRPVRARIIEHTSNPVIVKTQDFINDSSVTSTFNTSISQSVENTVSSGWSTGGALQVGASIEVGVSFSGLGGSASSSISYEQSWGINKEETRSIVLGTQSGVETTLEPGQGVTAN